MLKTSLLLTLIFLSESSFSQHPVLQNDTLSYNGHSFTVGDTLHLLYGSDPKKDFVFVFIGGALTGVSQLGSEWSKHDVRVDKVYKQQGKCYARGILLDAKGLMALGSNKIFIDIEGSVDNNELLINRVQNSQ